MTVINVTVSDSFPLAELTKGWTEEEVAKFHDGDPEAREAVLMEAVRCLRDGFSDDAVMEVI